MLSKLSKKTIIYYSLIAIPLAIVGLPLYIYLPTFYVSSVGLSVTSVGIILFIARLSDVFTDPFFGFLSDKSVSYFKSRKPLMIVGSFILVGSFYALINPSLEYKELWLFSFSILVYMGWSMINIPYFTWSSEISTRYEDKTLLNSSREMFTILGVLLALLVPFAYGVSQNPQKTLDLLYLTFVFLFIPFFFVSITNIKIQQRVKNEKFNLKKLKDIYIELHDLKFLQLGYFFNNLANALPATLFLLFIEYVIEEKQSSGMILILYFFSGIIALPLWYKLSNKIGKKKAWMSSIVLASVAFAFVPFLQSGNLIAFILISVVSGFSLGADMALSVSLQSDLAQRAKKIHDNVSGVLFGIWTMITKFVLALAVAMSFIILGFFDFDTSSPSSEALLVLTLFYGLIPVLLKIVSLFFIVKYKDQLQ